MPDGVYLNPFLIELTIGQIIEANLYFIPIIILTLLFVLYSAVKYRNSSLTFQLNIFVKSDKGQGNTLIF